MRENDGPRFKGRGFKQLTGRFNYAAYWVIKGWLIPGKDFETEWNLDPKKRCPEISNPSLIETNSYFCIEAGTWYITIFRKGAAAAMDADNNHDATFAINGWYTDEARRLAFTTRMKKVLP